MFTENNHNTPPGSSLNKSGQKHRYGLFDVVGIEMEYMIVDKTTLSVKPLCDVLMKAVAGVVVSDFDNGAIMWSNEIVNHVVELKTNGPVNHVTDVIKAFHANVVQINQILEHHNAVLMPSGAHPWMKPYTETNLWAHDSNDIYDLYNKIFDCRGHGWSNLQSTHLNLPFSNDEDFAQLHAAIRLILPILPALCASSPILDGMVTGYSDVRLETYRFNQQKIPSITGKVIPEAAFSENDYYQMIFNPMMNDIAPFDPDKILECHFLNSRGAIARFDRGAIEIRVIDIQECPTADLAIADGIISVLKMLIKDVPVLLLKDWHEDELAEIFNECIKWGEAAIVKNKKYLELWGLSENEESAQQLWKHLQNKVEPMMNNELSIIFKQIVDNGTLSTRIIKYLNNDYSHKKIYDAYSQLVICLNNNKLFNCQ